MLFSAAEIKQTFIKHTITFTEHTRNKLSYEHVTTAQSMKVATETFIPACGGCELK